MKIKRWFFGAAGLLSGGTAITIGCLIQLAGIGLHIWAVAIIAIHYESVFLAVAAMLLPVIASIWACVLFISHGNWLYPGVCIGYIGAILVGLLFFGLCGLAMKKSAEDAEDEPVDSGGTLTLLEEE